MKLSIYVVIVCSLATALGACGGAATSVSGNAAGGDGVRGNIDVSPNVNLPSGTKKKPADE